MYTIQNNLLPALVGILFLFFAVNLAANSPILSDDCYIRADIEPDQQERGFRAVSVSQSDLDLADWSNIDAATSTDFDITVVSLEGHQQSEVIQFSSFYADIQEGSTIHGVQLRLSGSSTHWGLIKESSIQFYLGDQAIGTNLAGKSNIAHPWKEEASTWEYGYVFSDWGIDWTPEILASKELSVKIQLENEDDQEFIEAYIDNIEIVVHYTELYTLCSHACVVLYNDEVPGATQYIWDVPEGVKFLNNDPEHRVVNLDFSNAADGVLDVGLKIVVGTDTLDCSRQVYHTICTDASVGDLVWFDENFDGVQADTEMGIPNVSMTLFNPYSEEISTLQTGADGSYRFEDIPRGFYFIRVHSEGFVVSPKNVADPDLDSDLLASLETDVFYLDGGDSIVNLDFGLFDEGSIAGTLWSECIGNGVLDTEDVLEEGVVLQLYLDDEWVQSTTTSDQGNYEFTGLLPGEYTVKIVSDELVSLANASSNPTVQNDFIDQSSHVTVLPGQDITELDAALNPKSDLSFDIFFDENGDGMMDDAEQIFNGMTAALMLYNEVVETAEIQLGSIQFSDLDAADYQLNIQIETEYSILQAEGFDLDDSSGNYVLTAFDLDCRNPSEYQLVLGAPAASIGDYVWYDANQNGIQDTDESGIADVRVFLYDADGVLVAETLTDDQGAYLFEGLEAGLYGLVIDHANTNQEITAFSATGDDVSKATVLNDQVVAGPIDLQLGVDQLHWDIGFKDKFGTISDRVWIDLNRNGLQDDGEPGLGKTDVTVYDNNDQKVAETSTNEDGLYSLDVPAGSYYVVFKHEEYLEFTNYDLSFDTDLNSDVNPMTGKTEVFTVQGDEVRKDIDAGYMPRTAIIGDFVFLDLDEDGFQDTDEPGLRNFMVEIYDEDGVLVASTTTDDSGYYELEVEAGKYYLQFSKDGFDEVSPQIPSDPENDSDITGQFGFGTTDMFSVDVFEVRKDIDAGFLTVPTTIGDFVWYDYNQNGIQDDIEIGQGNITVNLVKPGVGLVESTTSGNGFDNDKGYYSFTVETPGEYYIQFVLPDASWSFSEAGIFDSALDSDVTSDNGYGTTSIFEVEIGSDNVDIDAGVIGTSSILGDYVWLDKNNNGLQDADEEGVNGLNVFLYDEFFNFLDVTITTFNQESGHDGYYEFPEIEQGQYILVFDTTDPFTTANVGGNPDVDSDVTSEFVNGSTGIITLDEGSQMFNVDAGISNVNLGQIGQVGDMVWEDLNKNGVYEFNEKGIDGVYIELIKENGEVFADTKTDLNGQYAFEDVPVGEYSIFVELPDDYEATIIDNSFDDESDSDIKEDGYSHPFIVSGGVVLNSVDVGLVPSDGLIAGSVWQDSDFDGMMQSDEQRIAAVQVKLYDETAHLIAETETNEEGFYQFSELLVGDYYLEFTATSNYEFLPGGLNSDNMIASNEQGVGVSDMISLAMYDGFYAATNAAVFLNIALEEHIIDLEAEKEEDMSNLLHWTTSQLELSDYFLVERKVLNEDWEEIGTVLANEEMLFDYMDYDAKFIKEHIAYRVTQVTIADLRVQSPFQWVLYETAQNLNLYPNPTTDISTLEYDLEKEEMVAVKIYDLQGRLVRTVLDESLHEAGHYMQEVDVRGLSTGHYMVKYTSDSETRIQKIIVQ